MSLNNSSVFRTATRFKQLFVGPFTFKTDPTDLGTRPDRVWSTVRAAPGQTANIQEIQKSDGTVLSAFDLNGNLQTGALKSVTVTLTAAQILALFTTAIQLVAAPAAGQLLELTSATISYVFVSTAYTINGSTNLSIKYKDKTGADVSSTRATTGFIDQVTSQFSMFRPLAAQLALDVNAVAQPLVLACLVANPTLGDGTFKVNVIYRVHTL